jgi:glycosyltransferase involved in cell wall biosynthesis
MRVCFIATLPGMLPLLTGAKTIESGGGIQVQTALIGRGLAVRGHQVSFIVSDPYDGPAVLFDPGGMLKIVRAYDHSRGHRVVRPVSRACRVWNAMRSVDADIYIVQGAGPVAGLVRWFCRTRRRSFVFWSASAPDAACGEPGESQVSKWWRGAAYRGIRGADAIIAQTAEQREAFRRFMGREAVVIPNVWPIAGEGDSRLGTGSSRPADLPDVYALWVSNIRPEKRPHMALDVAESLRDVPVVLVGGPVPGHEDLYDEVRDRSQTIPNAVFCGLVPFSEVGAYFEAATVFLNTSAIEGYPNTYLQALAARLPIVATFDPDEVICRFGMGHHGDRVEDLAAAVRTFVDDSAAHEEAGRKGMAYLMEYHDLEAVLPRLERLLAELV